MPRQDGGHALGQVLTGLLAGRPATLRETSVMLVPEGVALDPTRVGTLIDYGPKIGLEAHPEAWRPLLDQISPRSAGSPASS